MSSIEQADKALARYYKQHDTAYFDNDGNGKFQSWADDNGFDTDLIEEEFDLDDVADSTLTDVDDNFPGDLEPEQIIAILKKCWTDKDAYTNEVAPLQVTAEHWKIDESDKKSIIKLYQSQCKTLFDQGMQGDTGIIKLLAVGAKLNEPYLQFLADMYTRDRLACDGGIPVNSWALNNKHCQELKALKIAGKPFTESVTAVDSFFHRIVPKLMLNTQREIVDSVQQTAKYLTACVDFVHTLAAQRGQLSCPFQMDFCIAFNETRDCCNMSLQGIEDDDSDEDDDDDLNEAKQDGAVAFFDCFGNIKDRLSKEKCVYTASIVDNVEEKGNVRNIPTARMFLKPFNDFKNTEIAEKYKNKHEFQEYPRKHRFCSLIDRRKPDLKSNDDKGTGEQDEILFFEPPNNCNSFPSDANQNAHVPLWYFDSSRTCIIPNIGYENGKHLKDIDAKTEHINDAKLKVLNEPITSQTACKGAMLILSFHVESENEIRAYLYINGQMSRFFPMDIINILPRFFDKTFANNKDFPKSQIASAFIDQMKPKLKDIKFEAFYSEYKNN